MRAAVALSVIVWVGVAVPLWMTGSLLFLFAGSLAAWITLVVSGGVLSRIQDRRRLNKRYERVRLWQTAQRQQRELFGRWDRSRN